MSVCTFIASDFPLTEVAPSQNAPLDVNIDNRTIYNGGADDNYFLTTFSRVGNYTNKKYGVCLEWHYTEGRAEQIVEYVKNALRESDILKKKNKQL